MTSFVSDPRAYLTANFIKGANEKLIKPIVNFALKDPAQ
jgi:hypothetical protein